MDRKERLNSSISSILRGFRSEGVAAERLSSREVDFRFAMERNGYHLLKNGDWAFSRDLLKPLLEEFTAQRVSFFGPNSGDSFFSGNKMGEKFFPSVLKKQPVVDAIRKYRRIDANQAARIAFLLGGIVRYKASHISDSDSAAGEIASAVEFAARMTALGEARSADAIMAAMSVYVVSGGSLQEDKQFKGHVFNMSQAITEDPIEPLRTEDLGFSQVARLRSLLDILQERKPREFPDMEENKKALDGFPTVGAEFHFPQDAPGKHPHFWQRLAILNMSQYQRGSYIQLSRNDRGVIEVRMNPSVYPVTIANWNHIRLLLPELNKTFFTITLNRSNYSNFFWETKKDRILLNKLHALGLLSYAGIFENVPPSMRNEEINFGSIYLGQTVRMINGNYNLSGTWHGSSERDNGQMAIYAGFGDNLPYLAYYLSMSLAKPDILETFGSSFPEVRTLNDAFAFPTSKRRNIFQTILGSVQRDDRLRQAHEAGTQITKLLNP